MMSIVMKIIIRYADYSSDVESSNDHGTKYSNKSNSKININIKMLMIIMLMLMLSYKRINGRIK